MGQVYDGSGGVPSGSEPSTATLVLAGKCSEMVLSVYDNNGLHLCSHLDSRIVKVKANIVMQSCRISSVAWQKLSIV